MLDGFYLREGGENRLSIPQGRYEIILGANQTNLDKDDALIGQAASANLDIDNTILNAGQRLIPKALRQNWVRYILTFAALLVVASSAYVFWPSKSDEVIAYPGIIVDRPAGQTNPESAKTAKLLENHLITGLEPFEQVNLFVKLQSSSERSTYLLRSVILDSASHHIQMKLIDRANDEIVWSTEITTDDRDQLNFELDRAVVAIAGPYGAITQSELSKKRDDYSVGYPCLLQFDQYLRYRDEKILDRVLRCLEKSATRFPNDAHLLSVLAFTKNLAWGTQGKRKNSVSGKELARRAEALNRNSATASFAMAQSAFFERDCQKGLVWGKQAVDLNPLNSRIIGYLGLYMIGCKIPEGEDFAKRALDLDPQADLAIAATLAFQMLKRGDAVGAKALSKKYRTSAPRIEPGLELTYILAAAKLGERREAKQAWKNLTARFGMPEETPPREVLSKWIANPLLVHEIGLVFDEIQLY